MIQDRRHATNSRPVVTISRGARADQAAEQAGDQKAEKGKKDDCRIHGGQPFIMLMSSTAIVPRLRIDR